MAIKPIFARESSQGLRLLCIAILALTLIVCDYKLQYFDRVRSSLSILTYPIIKIVDFPISVFSQIKLYFHSYNTLVLENEHLKLDSLILKGELQKLDTLLQENEQLRKLLHAGELQNTYYQVASILHVDPDPFCHHIIIDKGEQQSIQSGQAVIDESGLVGTVIGVTKNTSSVMLIADTSSAIPVENIRNGVRAIVVGTGKIDSLKLKHVTNNADLKVGDLLATSGLGGKLPVGFPVAKVTSITLDPSKPFANVDLEPVANLERNRHVLLIDPIEKAYD